MHRRLYPPFFWFWADYSKEVQPRHDCSGFVNYDVLNWHVPVSSPSTRQKTTTAIVDRNPTEWCGEELASCKLRVGQQLSHHLADVAQISDHSHVFPLSFMMILNANANL